MKNYSLRRRLLRLVGVPILFSSILTLLIGFLSAWHEIEEVYDAQMAHSAKILLQVVGYETIERGYKNIDLGKDGSLLQHRYENKSAFRIWYNDKILTQSWNADNFPDVGFLPGFSKVYIKDKPWRAFVFVDSDRKIKVEIAQRYAIRYELIGQLMMSLIFPAMIFIPAIFMIVAIGVHKALGPIVRISEDLDQRSTSDMTSIHTQNIPVEIIPMVSALNRLFSRIDDSFRREREFTDHAAHELRTPLAAMKTQTQVLMKKAANMPECEEGLENLESAINRATHLVNQLLALARLQNGSLPKRPFNLSDCLNHCISEMDDRKIKKNISLTCQISDHIEIDAHEDSIAILIGNLLDNAFKYTPDGGVILVSLAPDGVLEIVDNGPGIDDQDKVRVFERFVRADKTGQVGSGLGLSIVNWIIRAHEAKIALLDNIPHGLKVRITWNVVL